MVLKRNFYQERGVTVRDSKECILNNGQINQLNSLINDGRLISGLKDVNPFTQEDCVINININHDKVDTDKIIDEIIKNLNRR